jgi:hypothetical protein
MLNSIKNEDASVLNPNEVTDRRSSGLLENELQQKSETKVRALITFVFPEAFGPMIHNTFETPFPAEIAGGQLGLSSNDTSNPSLKLR